MLRGSPSRRWTFATLLLASCGQAGSGATNGDGGAGPQADARSGSDARTSPCASAYPLGESLPVWTCPSSAPAAGDWCCGGQGTVCSYDCSGRSLVAQNLSGPVVTAGLGRSQFQRYRRYPGPEPEAGADVHSRKLFFPLLRWRSQSSPRGSSGPLWRTTKGKRQRPSPGLGRGPGGSEIDTAAAVVPRSASPRRMQQASRSCPEGPRAASSGASLRLGTSRGSTCAPAGGSLGTGDTAETGTLRHRR
jgi:hypothetical protein